jgi:hypothetical protein
MDTRCSCYCAQPRPDFVSGIQSSGMISPSGAQFEHCRDYTNSQCGNLKMQSGAPERGLVRAFRETQAMRHTWGRESLERQL